jgi:predicted amidohydrolase
MSKLTVAITQMASENDWKKNCDKAEALVREAKAKGAQLILLQELFDGDYFCIEQHIRYFKNAHEIDRHPTVARFAALAKELGVVLPISVFERAGPAHYNTTVMADADGRQLGIYRKTHIPDGRGYQEKFYFSPGDTGFKVWDTAAGKVGLGICWDQWFPEAARIMGRKSCFIPQPSARSRETRITIPAAIGRTRCGAMRRPISCRWRPPTGWGGKWHPMGAPTRSMAGPSLPTSTAKGSPR